MEVLPKTNSNQTTLDLTKTVNILNDGYYILPDGVQCQLMYLSLGTVSGVNTVYVYIDHLRTNGNSDYQNALYFPFFGSAVTVLLFTGSSWQVVSKGTLD